MLLVETLVLGLVFGGAGRAAGRGAGGRAPRKVGIPAGGNETFYFFFSGPRLFPALEPDATSIAALVIVLLVSALSSSTRPCSPCGSRRVQAMQTEE